MDTSVSYFVNLAMQKENTYFCLVPLRGGRRSESAVDQQPYVLTLDVQKFTHGGFGVQGNQTYVSRKSGKSLGTL